MKQGPGYRIAAVTSREDLDATTALFRRYATSLDVDLAYQDFEAELATLPGKYAPPAGVLRLARSTDGTPIGCVALRPVPPEGSCEMKRLYVSSEGRGFGLGAALVRAVIEDAIRIGYSEIRLDTLPTMTAAMSLYRKLGFSEMPAYYHTPIEGTRFFRLVLPKR